MSRKNGREKENYESLNSNPEFLLNVECLEAEGCRGNNGRLLRKSIYVRRGE